MTAIKRIDSKSLISIGVKRLKSPYQIVSASTVDPPIGFFVEAVLAVANHRAEEFARSLDADPVQLGKPLEPILAAGEGGSGSTARETLWAVVLQEISVETSEFVSRLSTELNLNPSDLEIAVSELPMVLMSGATRIGAEAAQRSIETSGGKCEIKGMSEIGE